MRILQINKYFYNRGGAERVFLDTIDGLKQRGHEVSEFSVAHKKNLSSEYAGYFVQTEPELTGNRLDFVTSLKTFKHLVVSSEVDKKLRALAIDCEPQVAHLHNVVHQLSATLFKTLKKLGIPIVLTVHDVQPLCPNHRMLVKGRICERCYRHRYYNCARFKCIDNNRAKSVAAMAEAYYYHWRGIWDMVDVFICPSQFMLDKMVEWGFERQKLRLVRNFYPTSAEAWPLGDKIVYLGRLHEEKGIKYLMEAIRYLRDYQFIIAGSGPEEEFVQKNIRQYSLNYVEQLPRVQGRDWQKVMEQARVIVVPSLFYENCSIGILEALSYGRLVVTTDRGGNPEIITNGETGWLAEPENAESLKIFIHKAMELGETEAQAIVNNGRRLVMDQHGQDAYFTALQDIYEQVQKK